MNAMTRTTITSRAPVAARARATRAVVVRANAQDKSGNTEATTQETRRHFARNAALLAAAAFVSVAGNNQAHADEVPEKLKKKVTQPHYHCKRSVERRAHTNRHTY